MQIKEQQVASLQTLSAAGGRDFSHTISKSSWVHFLFAPIIIRTGSAASVGPNASDILTQVNIVHFFHINLQQKLIWGHQCLQGYRQNRVFSHLHHCIVHPASSAFAQVIHKCCTEHTNVGLQNFTISCQDYRIKTVCNHEEQTAQHIACPNQSQLDKDNTFG